jgi:hypothetical protein
MAFNTKIGNQAEQLSESKFSELENFQNGLV